MEFAEKLWWFYRDNCDAPPDTSKLGTIGFLNEVTNYLTDIILGCQRGLKELGNPQNLEGFDQILYADHIELHNRAVDLFNDLMERGIDIAVR
jgi:hypothetical protein